MEPYLSVEHRQAAVDEAIKILNDLFEADPGAVHALMANRVPCFNTALADHPAIVVTTAPIRGHQLYSISALQLINSVVEALTGERIAMKWYETIDGKRPLLVGFCKYSPPVPEPRREVL